MRGFWERVDIFFDLALGSEETRKNYHRKLRRWVAFRGGVWGKPSGKRAILEAKPSDCERFVIQARKTPGRPERGSRKPTPVTDASIYNTICSIRRFYNYLIKHGWLDFNPWLRTDIVLKPRAGKKRPTNMLDFERVYDVIEAAKHGANATRNACFTALAFAGGLRRQEIMRLRLCDYQQTSKGTHYFVLKYTKSGEDALQVIAPFARPIVKDYIAQRKSEGARHDDLLFAQPCGKRWCGHALYHGFKRALVRARIDPELYSPHSCRATAVTKLLDDGLSHREVQEFSRHASIFMVEVYDKRTTRLDDHPANSLHFEKKSS